MLLSTRMISSTIAFYTEDTEHACARGLLQLSLCVCVCVFVFPFAGANPQTGASRRLTEGTSGLNGTFVTIIKGVFSKTASLES